MGYLAFGMFLGFVYCGIERAWKSDGVFSRRAWDQHKKDMGL